MKETDEVDIAGLYKLLSSILKARTGIVLSAKDFAKLIKASKLSRNFFSHNPNIFAESDEALSLLSDSITIIKLLNR